MNTRFTLMGGALICFSLAGAAFAQDDDEVGGAPAFARYAVMPAKPATGTQPNVALPQWNGSFVYKGTTYTYHMVGTAPSSNTSTTIQTYIIPLKVVITNKKGTKVPYNPSHVLSNGNSVTQNTVLSPIFDSTTTYTQGGTDVGTTQYEDAFQRANFWGTVSSHTGYHVLLGGPTVLPTQTINVPTGHGSIATAFGVKAGLVDINYFDAQIQTIMTRLTQIQPNTLPIFLTYDVYLTESAPPTLNSCCIGGYHSATGTQAYSMATYVDAVGAFSQNVSALSHEVGEWMDDPLVGGENQVQCGILEVGDPLEGTANYGGFPYVLHGFTYDLQDLVFLTYFGAPTTTSLHGWLSFQDNTGLRVCSNGG